MSTVCIYLLSVDCHIFASFAEKPALGVSQRGKVLATELFPVSIFFFFVSIFTRCSASHRIRAVFYVPPPTKWTVAVGENTQKMRVRETEKERRRWEEKAAKRRRTVQKSSRPRISTDVGGLQKEEDMYVLCMSYTRTKKALAWTLPSSCSIRTRSTQWPRYNESLGRSRKFVISGIHFISNEGLVMKWTSKFARSVNSAYRVHYNWVTVWFCCFLAFSSRWIHSHGRRTEASLIRTTRS